MTRPLQMIRIAVVAGALAATGLAQTGGAAGTTTAPDTTTRSDNHDFNMGWFGLVGLAGLLGLRRPAQHTEPRSIDNTGPGPIR